MKSSSLYGHLTELLSLVREVPAPADATVRRFFRERRYLGAHERRWLSARLFGTVRHLRLLEHIVREVFQGLPDRYRALFAGQEPVPAFAVAAAHGIVFEKDAVPDVCEAVRERWIAAMPDVDPGPILSALADQAASFGRRPASVAVLALRHSFPESIVGEWADRLGIAETEQLLVSLNQEAPLSIRVNTLKCSVSACADRLNAEGTGVHPGALSPFALRLQRRVVLDTIPAFRDGWFEMQDEGSQLLSLLLRPEPGMTVVDACAGGGGKTLHLAALMQNRGRVIAIDPDRRKLQNLRDRAGRGGATLDQVIEARHNDPALSRLHGSADAVLVDVPCSGLGTVRRNPWLKLQWERGRRTGLPQLQHAILEAAALMVKSGGRLVYSTCTLVKAENEEVVERFLREHQDFSLGSAPEILRASSVEPGMDSPLLTLWPHRTGSDGFFAAVLERCPAS